MIRVGQLHGTKGRLIPGNVAVLVLDKNLLMEFGMVRVQLVAIFVSDRVAAHAIRVLARHARRRPYGVVADGDGIATAVAMGVLQHGHTSAVTTVLQLSSDLFCSMGRSNQADQQQANDKTTRGSGGHHHRRVEKFG
jgi:hypothetical protein